MPRSESAYEGRRLDLLKRLGEQLGEEEAETLMESLPPVPWDRLATKGDLQALEERLLHEVDKLRVGMDKFRVELVGLSDSVDSRFEKMNSRFDMVDSRFEKMNSRFDMVDSRFEKMDAEFKDLRGEMKAMEGRLTLQMANLSRTVIFAVIGFSLATVLSVVGMGLATAFA